MSTAPNRPDRLYLVEPGTDLDRALLEVEAGRESLELVHGRWRFHVVPTAGPAADPDLEFRRRLAAEMDRLRASQEPLGMSTADLIREVRDEWDKETGG